jgi:hypothetical protein
MGVSCRRYHARGNPSGQPLNPSVHVTVGDNQTLGVADAYIALDRGY